jgi:hypothetical protein
MRILTSLGVLLLSVWLSAASLTAQAVRPGGPSFRLQPAGAQSNSAVTGAPGWTNRLLTGLGGAALGAGMAFFASQVNQSDWEEIPGQREANRGLWSALGGSVGFAVGFSFPLTGRDAPRDLLKAPGGRAVISYYEIQDVSVDNAWDIVRLLRPEWLNARPPDNLGATDFETTTVYIDDFRYGDTVDWLRNIHVSTIETIRFVSPAQATARWGTGNVMGVIQVITIG